MNQTLALIMSIWLVLKKTTALLFTSPVRKSQRCMEMIWIVNYTVWDNSWFFNIVLGKSKEAIIYLEELAKTEQYDCPYLKWLTEYFHKNQYQANFENNRTNIPVECLDIKNNIAQYLAMTLMDDPIAVYGLSELVGPNAPSRFNICTLLFKSHKQRAIAMWDIKRAKWNGYQMKTVKPRNIFATIELHIPDKRYIRRICYDELYFVEIR
ncbi:MAG: hypothetical protein SOV49_03665 [Erysipelotrichaceae bacterium]|nr:hypothetical protein [Erysipelotrichaceae bacterium]